MKPLISIITITLDDLESLIKTWDSVRCQNFGNFQWVVVHGGNDRRVPKKISAIGDQRITVISENDNGIYDAMNKGILVSGGKYSIFINSGDELYDEGTLTELSQNLCEENTMYYGHTQLRYPGGKKILRKANAPSYIRHSLPTRHQSIVYPTNWLKNVMYDEEYRICGDYYITSSLINHGVKLEKVDVTLSKFYAGGVSTFSVFSLLTEAARVQNRVLKISKALIVVSVVYRFFNIMRNYIWYQVSMFRKKLGI